MAPDTDNSRVTLAVLGEKMDNLTDFVKGYCARNDEAAREREKRLQTLERRADVNDSQHTIMSGIGITLSAIASAIGAWVK